MSRQYLLMDFLLVEIGQAVILCYSWTLAKQWIRPQVATSLKDNKGNLEKYVHMIFVEIKGLRDEVTIQFLFVESDKKVMFLLLESLVFFCPGQVLVEKIINAARWEWNICHESSKALQMRWGTRIMHLLETYKLYTMDLVKLLRPHTTDFPQMVV